MANDKEKYGLDDEIEFDEVEVWSERSQHLFQVKSADSLPEHAVLKGYFRKYFQLDMYTERVVETLWEVFRQIMKNMPDSNINLRLTTLLEDLTAKMADTASEFAFVVKSKCESSETSAKCQASVMLENTEAVLDSLKTELRHMEAALRSALLIVSANKRISELRNKIANSKSSTNKLKEERQSLEEGEIDAGKRKRMAAINKTLEENAKNMRDWMERISELNQQIIGIETMFAEDKQEENDKYSTGLSTLFGAELMTPDLRAKVGELFAKPLCEVDFFVEYPAQIKAESVAPTSSKRFKKDTGARQYADAALSRLPDSRSITNDLHNINRHNA